MISNEEKKAIEAAFAKAEESGLLRFQVLPDEEMYDDSYIDTWDITEEEKVKEKLAIWARIEREGVWGIMVERYEKCDKCGREGWIRVEDCWGFVGNDYEDSGYDTDFKRAALDAIGWEY